MSEPSFFSGPMTVAKFWRLKPGQTRRRVDMGAPSRALTPNRFSSSTPRAVVASPLSRRERHVRGRSLDQKRRQDLPGARKGPGPRAKKPPHGGATRRDRRALGVLGVWQDLDFAHD